MDPYSGSSRTSRKYDTFFITIVQGEMQAFILEQKASKFEHFSRLDPEPDTEGKMECRSGSETSVLLYSVQQSGNEFFLEYYSVTYISR
jgi:hypothetical protein